ncbi:hypothetical protein SRHO_G00175730 [Serrasalmus rhombeus]
MEDQASSSASTSPPEIISDCLSVTAQNAGVAVAPQVANNNIDSLHITACKERVTQKLKHYLKIKYDKIFEGIAKRGNPTLLNKIYTELYITEGEREGLNKEHEELLAVSVSVQKFVLDWAEGKANQDIDLLLVLPFRELNSIKDEKQSLHELLLDFHSEFKELEDTKYYDDCKILFIFDGLDESQLPLDFGFTDLQKEEYFRKRISDQNEANRIISHVMDSGTLEIMCHIPVFCWITATVLEPMLKGGHEKIPSSLTELYTRFLLIQTIEKKKKYLGIRESDPRKLSNEDVQLVLKLGKLAFDNLQKSNIVFSEDDLKQYDIDVTEASLRSGLFTEIVKEEDPMFPVKKYSFVHLSFQEYLAAFFVVHTYADRGVNTMQFNEQKRATIFYDDDYYDDNTFYQDFGESDGFGHPQKAPQQKVTLYDLHKCAIDKAL